MNQWRSLRDQQAPSGGFFRMFSAPHPNIRSVDAATPSGSLE
jgi:hypothetical protein